MTNVIFAYNNLITNSQTITYSSQVPTMPVSYMANNFRSVVGRFNTATNEYIVVAFAGGAQPFNCLGIIGSNMTAVGTVTLYGSTDGGSTFPVQLIGPIVLQSNLTTGAMNSVSLFTGTGWSAYNAVKVLFTDPTNSAGYIQVAKVFLGTYFSPTRNYVYGWSAGYQDRSEMVESLNKVAHFNVKISQVLPDLPFKNMIDSDRIQFDTFFASVITTNPFIMAINPDQYPEKTYWVHLSTVPVPIQNNINLWDFKVSMKDWS